MKLRFLLRRLFITLCMLTRTTELAARRLGASFFLPALFVRRYAQMGGLDRGEFAKQLGAVRSFRDAAWCTYWNALAAEQLARAELAVEGIAGSAAEQPRGVSREAMPDLARLREVLRQATPSVVALFDLDAEPEGRAATALRHMIAATTYFQVSAFPGGSPARMDAYRLSRWYFDRLLDLAGTMLDVTIERHRIAAGDEIVDGYLIIPTGRRACPLVIVTNGLEGTVQELVLPLIRYRHSGLALFVMEMPGTYSYRAPMSGASEAIYHRVIDELANHACVDAKRIGFVGVSFGGYWAARMAAVSERLRCVVACGAPTHRSFLPGSSLGIPEIIIRALLDTTHAGGLHQLLSKLQGLSLRDAYSQIRTPLLVINGADDTLLSTRDSVELAAGAKDATLVLYPGDDHCAMGHYREWLDMSQAWLQKHLMAQE